MPAPNSLPQTKAQYIQSLVLGRGMALVEHAMFMYHAEVPLAKAQEYVVTYLGKRPEWADQTPK